MIDELITYKTAVLAKEKGFDIPVKYGVFGKKMKLTEDYGNHHHQIPILRNWNKTEAESFSIPTQSFLQRWLREVHKIDLSIKHVLRSGSIYFCILQTDIYNANGKGSIFLGDKNTYEEALEVGLQEGLKLIKS